MEKTTKTATRQDLLRQRDALVAELRFRPANGLPAREGTGLGGKFLSAAETAERSAAIGRLNAAIKAAEAGEKMARERRQAEEARRAADLAAAGPQGPAARGRGGGALPRRHAGRWCPYRPPRPKGRGQWVGTSCGNLRK